MNEPQQQDAAEETAGPDNTGRRPNVNFHGTGGLSVAVWKDRNEQGFDTYSAQIERRYRQPDGSFQKAKSFRDSDLLRVQQLIGLADAWIEQDKSKTRQASAASR